MTDTYNHTQEYIRKSCLGKNKCELEDDMMFPQPYAADTAEMFKCTTANEASAMFVRVMCSASPEQKKAFSLDVLGIEISCFMGILGSCIIAYLFS